MRPRHLILALIAGAALVVALGLLSACSSATPPSATGSPTAAPASAFGVAASAQYRFAIRYPLRWISAVHTAKATDKVVTTLQTMSWADPRGATVGGGLGYVDVLQVSVYQMSKPVGARDVVAHRAAFVAIVAALLKKLPDARITAPISPITLNGTQGLQVTYRYTTEGVKVGAMSYLLPKGHYGYWVTGQSSESTWASAWSKLAPAMASFTIKPIKAG